MQQCLPPFHLHNLLRLNYILNMAFWGSFDLQWIRMHVHAHTHTHTHTHTLKVDKFHSLAHSRSHCPKIYS